VCEEITGLLEAESNISVMMPTNTHPKAVVYQAEEAELSGGARIEAQHIGYSGKGYIAGYYNSGTACTTFTINVPSSGEYFVSLRYAAGAAGNWSTDRTIGLSINGGSIVKILFKNIDARWDVWSENIQRVRLKEGSNTIAYQCLTDNDNSDCINIDKLSVWLYHENPTIDQITFNPGNYVVSENYTIQTLLFDVNSNGILRKNRSEVAYSSSDSSIASVNASTGLITGVNEGTTIITALSHGLMTTATITVTANPVITVDFSSATRRVNPSTFGYILTPNYDVPDSRMKLLGPLLNRDTIPAQNFQAIGDLDGSCFSLEGSILARCLEAYHRAKSVGYQWYMLLGMSPSWAAPGGGPMDTMEKVHKKTPLQQAHFKQYIKDVLQYMKDSGAKPDFADLTNEYWTGLEETFKGNWEAVREVFPDFIPIVGPGAVGFSGISDYYIPYSSENNITLEGPCWHEYWVNDRYVTFSQLQEWKKVIADYQMKYPETNGKYIIWEENNAGSLHPTDWTRSMANVIRTGVTQNIKGCLEARNANGMSDFVTTNVLEQNPAARRPIWWVHFMFAQLSGHYAEVMTDLTEDFTATASVDLNETKIIFAKNDCDGLVNIRLNNQPYCGEDITIDLYKITSLENDGLQYQYSLTPASTNDISLIIDHVGANESWMILVKKIKSAPSFFYPILPDDGEVTVAKPTLQWSVAQGADSYTVIVSKNFDLSDPVILESGIQETIYTLKTELNLGHKYYWSVTAVNNYGNTQVFNQTSYSFIAGENADVPGQFGPYLPSVKAPNESITPEFKWSAAYKATSYRLLVSKNSDMSDPVINKDDITTVRDTGMYGPNTQAYYIPENALEYDTTYYWTVYAVNSYGERPMNGPLHYFTTRAEGDIPRNFRKLTPADGITDVTARTVLTWESSKNAFFYQLEISENSDMSKPIIVRERMIYHVYTVEPNLLKPDTTYYWRVTAYTKDLKYSVEASDGISVFKTEAVPCSPLLYAEKGENGKVKLWFQPSRSADSYQIKYGTASGTYTETIYNVPVSPFEVTGLLNGVKYYLAVTAVNEYGVSSIWNERCAIPTDNK